MLTFIRKSILAAAIATAAVAQGQAPLKWTNPLNLPEAAVQGRGWTAETAGTYHRLPPRAEAKVRKPLWDLSRNSAGLYLQFHTDAPTIAVRYCVEGQLGMPHMPPTGVSGVDLYRTDPDSGTPEFCFGSYHMADTITYRYAGLPAGEATYTLNLPLYNTVKWLEVGVPQGSSLVFDPVDGRRPLVVYGTSIAQGACSSRPGMAWANILRRQTGLPLINLGFSGNGRLEAALIDLMAEIDAAAYIIDCMPNLTPCSADSVTTLVVAAVNGLRSHSSAPIILVDHAGYSNAPTNDAQLELYTRLNVGQREAFRRLQAAGTPDLYYVTHDDLAYPADAWVDYVHPSDLGAQRQADVLTRRLRTILDAQ